MPHAFIRTVLCSAVSVAILAGATAAEARDQIRAVGSSTVFPFISAAAEQFGKAGKFKTPIVESTGTGGGLKLFCAGVGPEHPDIANASRQITAKEKEQCKKNGVKHVSEVPLGFDGIVLANSLKAPRFNLTREQVFLALARQVPKDGKLVNNPYNAWNEIDAALPAEPIEVYGPPPTSGTRDAFVEIVMEKSCEEFPEFKGAYANEKDRKKMCSLIREDGKYLEAGENDNLIVQKLTANEMALGIFGYSFLEQNSSSVQGSMISNIEPTFENIADGKYAISRSLFVYLKDDHSKVVPGLKEFAQEFTSEAAVGPDGYLSLKGLVPLPDAEREQARKIATDLAEIKL